MLECGLGFLSLWVWLNLAVLGLGELLGIRGRSMAVLIFRIVVVSVQAFIHLGHDTLCSRNFHFESYNL